ncbi:MAG: hypothetical protein ACYTFW_18885 [Planctomycetota bacterium]|jgi:hypothetical protein
MDIPNFKDILQKLSVFKNNLSLLVPVIIGLVSVLLFIPTQLMSSKLKGKVDQESIRGGGNSVRTLEGEAVSREQYKIEAERQKAHANDANEIANLAVQSTQRELLNYDIFPDPNSSSTLIFQEFGKIFRESIDALIVRANGRDCPTEEELDRGVADSSESSRTRRSSMRSPRTSSMGSPMPSSMRSSRRPSTGPYGGYGGYGRLNEIERMIVDQMCRERAESISVYVNPLDLSGYEYWANYKYDVKIEDAVEDCWYHQLAYWVIEDVFDTISTMNAGHDNILTAPVKRFLRITFTMGLKRPRSGASVMFRAPRGMRTKQTKDEDADRPSYVLSAADGLTESCTGRFSGDDIDVIHFNIAVVVGTKDVLPFMQELCSAKQHKFNGYLEPEQTQAFKHNQITVLESKIKAADPDERTHRNYRYGEDSVVELDLICEYIFNKKGYEEIIPEKVKKTLAGEDETE